MPSAFLFAQKRDLFSDTWVGVDALGRMLPTNQEVGSLKHDHKRVVGIFYVTWHTDDRYYEKSPYQADVSKILKIHPEARLNGKDPAWGPYHSYHWGEPIWGYFLSKDPYVIWKDLSMLSDAGVDVLILDVTNGVEYWDQWWQLFRIMEEMKAEGNPVPKFCFWAFNGPVITVVQDLYDRIYKKGLYKDLWFYWEGKPLLLYNRDPSVDANGTGIKNPNPHYDSLAAIDPENPHFGNPEYTEKYYRDYTTEVKHFFTLRNMWWGYHKWNGKRYVGTEDNWSFGYDLGDSLVSSMTPNQLVSKHHGEKEEFAVTPAQHATSLIGKSWTKKRGEPSLNKYDLPDSAYVPWLGKVVQHPEGYGIYFQQRWDEAIQADPLFLYINDWNEWTAGKYSPPDNHLINFMRRKSNYYFVDQYNAEFNRSIQPMKGGYTDNYYMQMVENIRKYKGVRPIPILRGYSHIRFDTSFKGWKSVYVEYRDTRGDTVHRNYNGYGGLHYVDTLGRNDFVTSKIAVDARYIYFYSETSNIISSYKSYGWMLLFINSDCDYSTGWNGYDYLINHDVINDTLTTLMRYDTKLMKWIKVCDLKYIIYGNKIMIRIHRNILRLTGNSFTMDFKWVDNPPNLDSMMSLCVSGDAAPDWRFNYRIVWVK